MSFFLMTYLLAGFVSIVYCVQAYNYITPIVTLDRKNIISKLTGVLSIVVRSEENYSQRGLRRSIQIIPHDRRSLMLIQFDYLDIDKSYGHPCKDKLTICELPPRNFRAANKCFHPIMENFCGGIDDFFGYGRYKSPDVGHRTTRAEGRGLYISWSTYLPKGEHRGFKLTISTYRSYLTYGYSQDHMLMFPCHDGMYIPMELHCDNVTNCADWSDETTNCSFRHALYNLPPGVISPGLRPKDKCVGMFGGQCALYKYWLSWTLPLIAILTLALIALKGSRLRQRRHLLSQVRLERLHELREAAEQHLQIHRLHYHHEDPPPPIDTVDAVVVPVLEPPPYSPREQPPPYKEQDEINATLTSELDQSKDDTEVVPLQTQV